MTSTELGDMPEELLSVVFSTLTPTDLSRLARSSKHLHQRVIPFLYGRKYRNWAVEWACTTGIIKGRASREFVQLLMEQGADPNRSWGYLQRETVSPLSAAVLGSSDAIFTVLIGHGASIHGPEVSYLPRAGLHIPIFAAAKALATQSKGRAMFEMCLDQGANINQHLPVLASYGVLSPPAQTRRRKFDARSYFYTTPLLVFLEAVESWKESTYPDPLDALKWLFDQGARPPVDDLNEVHPITTAWRRHDFYYAVGKVRGYPIRHDKPLLRSYIHILGERERVVERSFRRFGATCIEAPTALDLLIDKWGLQALTKPRFAAAISLLFRNGTAKGHTARLLLKYGERYSIITKQTVENKRTQAGREILTAILLSGPHVDNPSQTLATFVMGRSTNGGYSSSRPHTAVLSTIQQLLAAGADINTRSSGGADGPTILHRICKNVNTYESAHVSDLFTYMPPNYGSWLSLSLIPLLLENGADPAITTDGNTALDVLLEGIDEFRRKGSEEYVRGLADIIRNGLRRPNEEITVLVIRPRSPKVVTEES